MRTLAATVFVMGLFFLLDSTASAQVVVLRPVHHRRVYAPVVAAYPVPAVVHSNRVVSYSPVIAPPRVVNGAQVQVASPPVVTHGPVIAQPPVVAYGTPTYVVPARRIVVRPKVYVRGQPIRNFFRAITP